MAYSPFQKKLDDLNPGDLAILRNVAEGWYVEYKREIPNSPSIAKSISAFANTYGGWLFYGVEENSKDEAVASAFPGVLRSEVEAALQKIRQAVASHVNPSPHFNVKVLWGSDQTIGLEMDRAVICVHVPWSPNTPHVHKSGQIYRRIADGSEPKPETDRFVLDQLWRRGDKVRQEYKRWVNKVPDFSRAEAERPYLRLLLVADLWQDRDIWADVELKDVRSIMRSQGPHANIPFETVHTSATGFVARQRTDNPPHELGLTWWFRQDLRSEVLIPLNRYQVNSPEAFGFEMNGFVHAERFARILQTQGYEDAKIIDLNLLFSILTGVINIQDRLSTSAGWAGPLWAKVQLLNVWRTCPFIDLDTVLNEYETHGIPMVLESDVEVLPGSAPSTFFEVGNYDTVESVEGRVVLKAMALFLPIARALGVPLWVSSDEHDEQWVLPAELHQAAIRATEAQHLRLERKSQQRRAR
jgi:hypothetical protein